MTGAKQLLISQTAGAFSGRPDMSLKASLEKITQDEASWRPSDDVPTIDQLVRHIAWSKSSFCRRGFGTAMPLSDPDINDDGDTPGLPAEFPCGAGWAACLAPGIHRAIELLDQAQAVLTQCLESCDEEALDRPIPTHHGKSAANFFWIMLMHDIYHAGQIRTRRTVFRAGGHPL
ncbi:MAG: DinB family protein [Tepidisphaeraceae bacterium]|jgi:uncharacterized damage-inducible protein DinB